MTELEGIGMVVVALGSIIGLIVAVSGPLVKLNSAITRLETVLTALQDKMADAGSTIKAIDSRLDRVETTATEHGLRIERLEEECAKHRQRT